jgi:fatty-acyl-CoA synthase
MDAFGSKFGIAVTQVWGMAEISPIGALAGAPPKHAAGSAERMANLQTKQGRPPFGVEMRLIDDDGRNVPHDGQTSGHLLVRGPWVASGYFRSNGAPLDTDGFLDTGDVGTIDPDGYLRVTDRAADAIRAGGDWMSSGEIESIAAGHPAVFQAVMIVPANARARGRRLLLILRRTDFELIRGEILEYLAGRVDRRWLPDDVAFVDSLPLTATGKIRKAQLREAFADHRWTTDTELTAA